MSDSITLPTVEGRDAITLRVEEWANKEIEIDVRQGECRLTNFFTTRNGLLELRDFIDGLIAVVPELDTADLQISSDFTPTFLRLELPEYNPFPKRLGVVNDRHELITKIRGADIVSFIENTVEPTAVTLNLNWLSELLGQFDLMSLYDFRYRSSTTLIPFLEAYCRELFEYYDNKTNGTYATAQRLDILNSLVELDQRRRITLNLATLEDVALHLLGLQQCTKPLR